VNQRPDKIIPALYGGIIMAIISAVPFLSMLNCLCCAGIMLGGFLGVYFYKNNFTPDTPPMTSGDCMGVGALAGVFGAVFGTILSVVFLALFGNIMGRFITEMLQNMNVNLPEEALTAIEESMEQGMSFISLIFQFMASLVIDAVFGLLGGLIAFSVYKPKQTPMPPSPMPPPAPIQ
jgi:hypothetical protein